MNLDQVNTYIREPHLLGPDQAPALKQLCDDFPYTAVYPLLYLTALANAKSPLLEDALAKYAYRLSDRTRLYNLVAFTDTGDSSLAVDEPASVPQPEKETTESNVSDAKEVENKPEHSLAGDKEDQTAKAETDQFSEEQPRFDYLTTARSVEQEYFLLPDDRSEPESEIRVTAEETAPAAPPSEENTPTGPRSFMEWIKSNGHAIPAKQSVQDPALSKQEIIDRFIETQPTITRQKAEFFSPPKKAKESLNEEAMPVSETLAKIFTAQGNYPKAIHVYHQLMLANPEKKTFFAIQIEELKKKLTI